MITKQVCGLQYSVAQVCDYYVLLDGGDEISFDPKEIIENIEEVTCTVCL